MFRSHSMCLDKSKGDCMGLSISFCETHITPPSNVTLTIARTRVDVSLVTVPYKMGDVCNPICWPLVTSSRANQPNEPRGDSSWIQKETNLNKPYPILSIHTRWCPSSLAFSWFISTISLGLMNGGYIYSYWDYKPTYNWGGTTLHYLWIIHLNPI